MSELRDIILNEMKVKPEIDSESEIATLFVLLKLMFNHTALFKLWY